MWWTDWVKTLGSGFVGSLVGFLGVAWTLRSNRRWEVRKIQEQRQWELELMQAQRRWELDRAEAAKAEERMNELRGHLFQLRGLLFSSANHALLLERRQEYLEHVMTILPLLSRRYPHTFTWFNYYSERLLDVAMSEQMGEEEFQKAHRDLLEGIIHWVAEPELSDGFFRGYSEEFDSLYPSHC